MKIRSQLVLSEIVLSVINGIFLLLWLLNIATLPILFVSEYIVSNVALILWFRRTDEIDRERKKD